MEEKSANSDAVLSGQPGSHLSVKQCLYLLLIQGVGSAILDGAINFGLATAMYRNSPIPVTVWPIPGSLAGDAAVTIMVQVTLTWIIAGVLTRRDVQKGMIEPIMWTPPSRPLWASAFFFRGNFDFISQGQQKRVLRLFLSALRGVIFAAVVGIFVWPLSLAYLISVFGNNGIIPNWPTPQIFKAVFAAVLGLITTPPISALALVEAYTAASQSLSPSSILPTKTADIRADALVPTLQKVDSSVNVPEVDIAVNEA